MTTTLTALMREPMRPPNASNVLLVAWALGLFAVGFCCFFILISLLLSLRVFVFCNILTPRYLRVVNLLSTGWLQFVFYEEIEEGQAETAMSFRRRRRKPPCVNKASAGRPIDRSEGK